MRDCVIRSSGATERPETRCMSSLLRTGRRQAPQAVLGIAIAMATGYGSALAANPSLPITPEWRATAKQVAEAGVPLSDLAENAPDFHVVKPGDTLWDISKLFLKSPWRWPELWGMNLDHIRNPHLIYPGQRLVLERLNGRARLRLAQDGADGAGSNTVKLSPRVRAQMLDNGAIASIPLHLIGPFLNEAVVFSTGELELAPRIVATQEGRVMLSKGEAAYVRGDLRGATDFRLFRRPKALLDPVTRETLGYEAAYVGAAEFERAGEDRVGADGKPEIVPDTFRIKSVRLEAGVGDRLSPTPARELLAYVPHAPSAPLEGRVISIYGDSINAGQNQIVALNKGQQDGVERGHVLALWRAGRGTVDATTPGVRTPIRLPDERHGLLFVFRVFERVSYALILSVQDPVQSGDRFTQP